MTAPQPSKPASIDPLAAELLIGLGDFAASRHVVLGGYFALKHYHDYRPTHDIDAWWSTDAGEAERQQVRDALQRVLAKLATQHGLTGKVRQFGDTESWELLRDDRKIFSFQIAARTLQIAPYLPSPWPPLLIESLEDNIGSKMNALVQRAAPRDFLDIYSLAQARMIAPNECWNLWKRKNPDLALETARAEVARHQQELELRRPLNSISSPDDRRRAESLRTWFRQEFLSNP